MPSSALTVTPLTASGVSHYWDNIPNLGLILWLDASKITGIVSGTSLSFWTDSSASLSHASQPSAVSQPVFLTSQQNGLSAVSWSDTAAGIYMVSNTSLTQPCTVAMAVMSRVTATAATFVGGGGSTIAVIDNLGTGNYGAFWGSSAGISAYTHAAWVNAIAIASGSSTTLSVSGKTVFGNLGTNNATQVLLGVLTAPNTQVFRGQLGEVLVYNRNITETERVQIQGYLKSKWSTL